METGLRQRNSFSGNICLKFSVLVLCSVANKSTYEYKKEVWSIRDVRSGTRPVQTNLLEYFSVCKTRGLEVISCLFERMIRRRKSATLYQIR